jgi:phenylalanyl-tRNA synthetase beta chain
VFGLFGIQGLQSEPVKDISFEEGLIFKIDKIEIARFGLVSSKILKKFDISQKVFFADIKWEALMEHQNNVGLILKALPKFPSVKRDYSLLIDKEITYDELCKTAFSVERKLLKKVDLFDVYEGEKIPSTKKSYALTFVLQDSSKTMQDKQIDKIMQKLANAFEKQFGATLRS